MRLQAKITKVLECRFGINQQTQKPWKCTDFVISFEECYPNSAPITHTTVASSWGELDMAMVNKAVNDSALLSLFVVFGAREWSGRSYCDNVVKFPAEFYKK